jgi:hypothetical protein
MTLGWLLAMPSPADAEVRPFGQLECVPRDGLRYCEGGVATRVESFDGVPLDANVTLPASGDTGLPLVVQLHGWGGSKEGFAEAQPFAERGYAVLSYSARGFGDSCGSEESRSHPGCRRGWVHLADSRWEVRDTQHLAGLLADEGLVDPQGVAAVGISYGGGQALQLTTLRDHMRLGALPGEPDGALVPWTSPGGIPMRVAAAAPIVPWSDLVYSLMPNGTTLDHATPTAKDLFPVGVMKESYVSGLYASGKQNGYYCGDEPDMPCDDPSADLNAWYALIQAGEPYQRALAEPILREIAENHSAYHLESPGGPAPTLISNGFTDDLFPANEALRYANRFPDAPIAQVHFDYGHPRGQNKPADIAHLEGRIHDWFDAHVRGAGDRAPLAGVEVLTQTCPRSAPSGGPFAAPDWNALHPGEVRFTSERGATVLSAAPDAFGAHVDPLASSGVADFPDPLDPLLPGDLACEQTPAIDQAGTGTYRLPAVRTPYTLMGSPTLSVDLTVIGARPEDTQLAGRLWDVSADGSSQTLVARGVLRPQRDGRTVFQLFPNAYRFERGHVPKLELLGHDAPFLRPSNVPFSIGLGRVELRLPTHESSGEQVKRPKRQPRPG